MSSVGKGLGLALGGAAVAGVVGLGAALVNGAKDAAAYEQITAQVAQTIKSTGGAAGVTVGQLKDYAGQLESQSGVDEELILNGQNVLLTFTKVRNEVGKGNDVFNQASQAALDLSTTMGGDLAGANVLVGKALNDPIKGIGALSKAGVALTAEQKEQIKTMVESGNTMGAQKIILGELTTQFGGAAEAAGSGLTGSIARAKDVFGDFFRTVAEKGLPVLTDAAEWLADNLPAAFAAVSSAVAPVITFLRDDLVPTVRTVIDTVVGIFRGGADGTGGEMTRLTQLVGQAVDFVKTYLEAMRVAFDTAVTVITFLWQMFGDKILSYVRATFNNIITVVSGVLTILKGILDVFIGVFTGDWGRAWDGIKGIVSGAWDVIKGVVTQALNYLKTMISIALTAIGALLGLAWDGIVNVSKAAWGKLTDAVSAALDKVLGWLRGLASRAASAGGDLGSTLAGKGRDLLDGALDGIKAGWTAASKWLSGTASRAANAVGNVASTLASEGKDLIGGFLSGVINGWVNIGKYLAGTGSRALAGIGNLKNLLVSVGGDIVDGLARGIRAGVNRIGEALLSLIPGPLKKFADKLGISSPSRVFADFGVNIGEGLAMGITATEPIVTRSVSDLADATDLSGLFNGPSDFVFQRLAETATAPVPAPAMAGAGSTTSGQPPRIYHLELTNTGEPVTEATIMAAFQAMEWNAGGVP